MPDDSPKPPVSRPFIFIVGVPRSGTTLLSSMLNAHSQLAIPYESNFMVHCYRKFGLTPDLANDTALEYLINEILSGSVVSKWNPAVHKDDLNLNNCKDLPSVINEIYRCYAKKKGKLIWGDKTPNYTKNIEVLNRIFPNAKYIHIIRDGRDVALSLIQRSWGPSNFHSTLQLWKEMVLRAQAQLSMLPDDRYLELRFEDLVKNPKYNLKQACSLLDIDFEEEMINRYSNEWSSLPPEVKKIHRNLQESPSEQQCFKWKKILDGPDQAIAYEIAGDLLEKNNYDVSVKHHRLKIIKKIYHHILESIAWRLRRLRA